MNQFLQKNKISLVFFVIGVILQATYLYHYFKTDWAITPTLTYFNLISLLLLSLAFFLFSVKNKIYIISNLVLLVFLVLTVEIVCFVLLDSPEKYKKDFSLPFVPIDHVANNIGTVPYADSVYHSVLIKDNKTVYDVNYTIDNNWKRVTPDFDSTRSKYALFFGCSIAFGEGLDDSLTFPCHFQNLTSEYNSYNFAYPGYGANQMLARMEFQNLTEQVKEKDGIGFYLFFMGHVSRVIGSMDTYVGWTSGSPYYYMKDGKLFRDRMFKNGRYWVSKFYELVYQTSIINYFKINFPNKLQPKHYELTVEVIQASKEKYIEQFGNNNFYVILYPSYKIVPKEDYELFKQLLAKKEIKYVDLDNFIEYDENHTLGGDPHPNGNTNKILVEELIKRLNK
ncbi:MAG: hypothetical protein CO118_05195 [Flavobacteriales bacterium CG_4_9_14_3_um_filter_32_8]|nr:MAG: hypothetical protein CO118_05195 [Flavobacteriales bacterium CG_4_9_14_3_um_filter_32_8]